MIQLDAKINCFIDVDDKDRYHLQVSLTKDLTSVILEYADITKEVLDFLEISHEYELYSRESDLLEDLESAHLFRYLSIPRINDRLNLLVNIKMKKQHLEGKCKNSCILCNPDLGDDPFPDFTFDVKTSRTRKIN